MTKRREMGSNWRPKNWLKIKGDILDSPRRPPSYTIDWIMEETAEAVLEAYLDSDEFGEEASIYCEGMGWKRPA